MFDAEYSSREAEILYFNAEESRALVASLVEPFTPNEKLASALKRHDKELFAGLSTESKGLSQESQRLSQESPGLSQESPGLSQESKGQEHLLNELPLTLRQSVVGLGRRARDTDRINGVILALCAFRPFQARELADLLGRRSDYLRRRYITPLLHQGALVYRFPDEPNRPDQAYISSGEDE